MTYQKVKLIEQVPLSLNNKVALLLTYANQKPSAWMMILGSNYDSENNIYRVLDNDVRGVERVLDKIKLLYLTDAKEVWRAAPPQKFCPRGLYTERVQIYVAKAEELTDKLKQAVENRDSYEVGQLMGYPETAIQAFHGERPPFMSDLSDGTPYSFFTQFVFSQDFFDEEYQSTCMRWHDTVKRLSPKLYAEISKEKPLLQKDDGPYWR